MADLLSFQPKKAVHSMPRHLLRDMAELGATLLYVVDEDGTRIDYQHARQHTTRVRVLMARLKDCGEQWHIRYLALVMNLLHIDHDLDDLSPGTCLRLDLAGSFVDPFPDNGFEALRLFLRLNRQINEDPRPRRDPIWISLINRRNDLLWFLQNEAGDQYRHDCSTEALRMQALDKGGAL